MARGRKRARVIAAIVSPLLFLGLVESVLRFAGYRHVPYAAERTEEDRRLPTDLYARHPVLLWTLPPDSTVDLPEAGFPSVSSNPLGLRGRVPPAERVPGELRVLCLGDSVTFGLGVPDGSSWPERLEERLAGSPALKSRPVTVLNGAIPGWSSVQGMRQLDELAWFEPDVVVFWFGMNDVQRAWGRRDARKGGTPGMLDDIVAALYRLRTVQLLAQVAESARGGGEETRASVEDFRAAVSRLRDLQSAGGPRTIFVRVPEQLDLTEAQLAGIVARMEEEGVQQVVGPHPLLHSITPAPNVTRIGGRVSQGPKGKELWLGGRNLVRRDLEGLRRDLADIRSWKAGLDERLALLPADSPDGKEMFGDTPPAEVFSDNCHLTERGCDLAAAAIAMRIVALIGE